MTKERRSRLKKSLIYTILILISLALIFNRQIGYFITDLTINHASKITGSGLEPIYDVDQVEPYSSTAALEAAFSAKDVRAAGQISIPSVDMSLPIYQGLNDVHLYLGAAEHNPRENVTPAKNGNYILASHYVAHYGSLFEPLTRVKSGDKIYVAFNDKVYEYSVESLNKIDTSDDSWLQDTDKERLITLYTCVSLDYPNLRWLVRGKFVKEYKLDDTLPQEIVNSFAKDSTLRGTYLESYEWLRPD